MQTAVEVVQNSTLRGHSHHRLESAERRARGSEGEAVCDEKGLTAWGNCGIMQVPGLRACKNGGTLFHLMVTWAVAGKL